MKKGPARHTRTPQSSLPEPNTSFQLILSLRDSIPEPILNKKNRKLYESQRAGKEKQGKGVSFSLYPGAQLILNPYSIFNEYCRRSPRGSPLSKVFYNRPLLLGPALIKSRSVCLVIGTCYCEVIFTLSGDPRGERRYQPMTPRVGF